MFQQCFLMLLGFFALSACTEKNMTGDYSTIVTMPDGRKAPVTFRILQNADGTLSGTFVSPGRVPEAQVRGLAGGFFHYDVQLEIGAGDCRGTMPGTIRLRGDRMTLELKGNANCPDFNPRYELSRSATG